MTQESNSNWLAITIRFLLFGAFAFGATKCVELISQGKLTDRESAVIGILVAVLSVLASWIITDMYSSFQYKNAIKDMKEEYRSNLRTYALKAAEKVNNLSNELSKLSVYLDEELNYTNYRSSEEELLAKEERIESAIHLIRTLKSVNDTSLSDWEGVIGDELSEQREEKEERQEALRQVLEKAEALVADDPQQKHARRHLEELQREIRIATLQLNDMSVGKLARKREPKQDVKKECPSCHSEVTYRQRASTRSYKSIPCQSCGMRLVSTYSEGDGFSLKVRKPERADVGCPHCEAKFAVELDNFPTSSVSIVCPSCNQTFRAARTVEGVELQSILQGEGLAARSPPLPSEETLERVRKAMPAQPWPSGAHREVAAQLGLTPGAVQRATRELIRRGVFLHQIEGVLYAPVNKAPRSTE